MKTKFKRIIFFILIFTLLIFTQTCKKGEATSTEGSADLITATDSTVAVADSASSVVDSAAAVTIEAAKDAEATTENSGSSNDYYDEYSNEAYSASGYEETISNQDTAAPDETQPPAKHIQIDNLDEIKNKMEHIKKIKANTFIYAPENMSKGNNYTVMAMVNMKDIQESAKSFTAKVKKSNHGSINIDDIKGKENVVVTNKIKVSMKYDDDIFKIINSDDGMVKILDENHKELLWKWNVKPENYCSKTQLTFIFQSMDNDEVLFEEEMFVDVNISVPNGIKGYLGYLIDNPQYTFPAMVIPLATFFAGRFLKRKKEKGTGSEPE